MQEYLRRFADLILTSSGLGLPLEEKRPVADAHVYQKFLTAEMHKSASFASSLGEQQGVQVQPQQRVVSQ